MKPNSPSPTANAEAWRGFTPGLWQRDINVRWFIQQNFTPYDGDEQFLSPSTERTRQIWKRLEVLFVEERKQGVLDISQVPSSITAHAPGYIDRDNEIIVGIHRVTSEHSTIRMWVARRKGRSTNPDERFRSFGQMSNVQM